ncbi:hypothetical protein D3C84_1247880 [compost metagenome]
MDQIEVLFNQRREAHFRRQSRWREQRDVDTATDQLVDQVAGQLFIQLQFHLGVFPAHCLQQRQGNDR